MNEFTIIRFGWNNYNGFIFKLIDIELNNFEGALLGLSIGWNEFFIIDMFYITIELKKPWFI